MRQVLTFALADPSEPRIFAVKVESLRLKDRSGGSEMQENTYFDNPQTLQIQSVASKNFLRTNSNEITTEPPVILDKLALQEQQPPNARKSLNVKTYQSIQEPSENGSHQSRPGSVHSSDHMIKRGDSPPDQCEKEQQQLESVVTAKKEVEQLLKDSSSRTYNEQILQTKEPKLPKLEFNAEKIKLYGNYGASRKLMSSLIYGRSRTRSIKISSNVLGAKNEAAESFARPGQDLLLLTMQPSRRDSQQVQVKTGQFIFSQKIEMTDRNSNRGETLLGWASNRHSQKEGSYNFNPSALTPTRGQFAIAGSRHSKNLRNSIIKLSFPAEDQASLARKATESAQLIPSKINTEIASSHAFQEEKKKELSIINADTIESQEKGSQVILEAYDMPNRDNIISLKQIETLDGTELEGQYLNTTQTSIAQIPFVQAIKTSSSRSKAESIIAQKANQNQKPETNFVEQQRLLTAFLTSPKQNFYKQGTRTNLQSSAQRYTRQETRNTTGKTTRNQYTAIKSFDDRARAFHFQENRSQVAQAVHNSNIYLHSKDQNCNQAPVKLRNLFTNQGSNSENLSDIHYKFGSGNKNSLISSLVLGQHESQQQFHDYVSSQMVSKNARRSGSKYFQRTSRLTSSFQQEQEELSKMLNPWSSVLGGQSQRYYKQKQYVPSGRKLLNQSPNQPVPKVSDDLKNRVQTAPQSPGCAGFYRTSVNQFNRRQIVSSFTDMQSLAESTRTGDDSQSNHIVSINLESQLFNRFKAQRKSQKTQARYPVEQALQIKQNSSQYLNRRKRPHTNQVNSRFNRTSNEVESGSFTVEKGISQPLIVRNHDETEKEKTETMKIEKFGPINIVNTVNEHRVLTPSTANFMSRELLKLKAEDDIKQQASNKVSTSDNAINSSQQNIRSKDINLLILQKLDKKQTGKSISIVNYLSATSSSATKIALQETLSPPKQATQAVDRTYNKMRQSRIMRKSSRPKLNDRILRQIKLQQRQMIRQLSPNTRVAPRITEPDMEKINDAAQDTNVLDSSLMLVSKTPEVPSPSIEHKSPFPQKKVMPISEYSFQDSKINRNNTSRPSPQRSTESKVNQRGETSGLSNLQVNKKVTNLGSRGPVPAVTINLRQNQHFFRGQVLQQIQIHEPMSDYQYTILGDIIHKQGGVRRPEVCVQNRQFLRTPNQSPPSNQDDKSSVQAPTNFIDLIPKYQDSVKNALTEQSSLHFMAQTLTEKKKQNMNLQHHVVPLQKNKHVSQLMSPRQSMINCEEPGQNWIQAHQECTDDRQNQHSTENVRKGSCEESFFVGINNQVGLFSSEVPLNSVRSEHDPSFSLTNLKLSLQPGFDGKCNSED